MPIKADSEGGPDLRSGEMMNCDRLKILFADISSQYINIVMVCFVLNIKFIIGICLNIETRSNILSVMIQIKKKNLIIITKINLHFDFLQIYYRNIKKYYYKRNIIFLNNQF